MHKLPDVGKSSQYGLRRFAVRRSAVLKPCDDATDWQLSPDFSVYVVPTQPVGVGVTPDVLGGVPFVTYKVVVAGGVTAKPVLLHCFVKDVKVEARSGFEDSAMEISLSVNILDSSY